ncbi:hypothetical protein AYI70_g11274 [Smittium culicis]|uniref:Uncharacterized protein n=1 Tax=Smittium culicis TaxID=133412 RepID=A0A1R1X2J5_9FUNG|nr:hypothetical protein AYI70_g11274 [Smittium culicis]
MDPCQFQNWAHNFREGMRAQWQNKLQNTKLPFLLLDSPPLTLGGGDPVRTSFRGRFVFFDDRYKSFCRFGPCSTKKTLNGFLVILTVRFRFLRRYFETLLHNVTDKLIFCKLFSGSPEHQEAPSHYMSD